MNFESKLIASVFLIISISVSASPDATPTKIKFILPFDSKTEVVCTHASGVGSHSWPNAFYALDLATDYNLPASKVRAAADGKVFLFSKKSGGLCSEPTDPPSKTKTDDCGNSWGNQVKVLHADGYYSFYVHLKDFLVKEGQMVKAGDILGTEGATGMAAHRHLHWSVQKLPGKNQKEWEAHISWDGKSVPFEFEAVLNGKKQTLNTATFQCPHANIGQVPNQPRLRGLFPHP